MSALLELAERCEKTTGPDRDLDVAIECALPLHDYVLEVRPARQRGTATSYYRGGTHGTGVVVTYTGSLDRALMLVPKGWRLQHFGQAHKFDRWCAQLANDGCDSRFAAEDDVSFISCTGNTKEGAICAAGLRALASQRPS